MSKTANISGREADNAWHLKESKGERREITIHDGTHLKDMIVTSLKQAGADTFANQIAALVVVPQAGYDAAARRTWSLENVRGGFGVKVLTKNSAGEDAITGDYEGQVYPTIQEAIAGLIDALGAPVFSAQIAAL